MASRIKKKVLVIYHGGCLDGFGGAWAAWRKLGDKAEYVAAARGVSPPDVKGKEVCCIDFTYNPISAVRKMARDAARLVIIDHHITAEPAMRFAHDHRFSLKHSGSALAWEYFNPGKPTPELLRYIEDGDLWRFRLPRSREIGEYISLWEPISRRFAQREVKSDAAYFREWDKLAAELRRASGRRRAAAEGALLLRHQSGIVAEAVRGARLVRFAGHTVCAANSPAFESEIGNALAAKRPPFAVVWSEQGGKIRVSLRAIGRFDVSKIAEKYGGGGHSNAAGFNLPRDRKLPWT